MFKIGDEIIAVTKDLRDEDWVGIGRVDFEFEIGDYLTVVDISYNRGISFRGKSGYCSSYYPSKCFVLNKGIKYIPNVIVKKLFRNQQPQQKQIIIF